MPLADCMNANYMFPIPPPAGVFQHVHVSPFHNQVHFPDFQLQARMISLELWGDYLEVR